MSEKSDYSGEVVDVEVARYGLRTFRFISAEEAAMSHEAYLHHQLQWMRYSLFGSDYRDYLYRPMELCSTAMTGSHWKTGVCEATCQKQLTPFEQRRIELAALTEGVEAVYAHPAPQEDCHCGIYAAHTLRTLRDQFGSYVDNIVAVIAAEGQTIIGDKGFRTQRARVVAYWCSERIAATAKIQFADAQRYSTILPMLAQYGLEAGAQPPTFNQADYQAMYHTLMIHKGDPGPLLSRSKKRHRRKVAAALPNFAASALNGSIYALWGGPWALGLAIASFVLGVALLMVVKP